MSGTEENPEVSMRIHEPMRFIWRILTRGEIGFAEAYIKGLWDTPELTNLLYFCELNEEAMCELGTALKVFRLFDRLRHILKRNHRIGSRRNIRRHYDLGNHFYRQWLDSTMTYSCAIFEAERESLPRAQLRKYQRILESLEADPGQHILEIGCGWGGFAELAANQGYRVTGVTLSREQLTYARQRIACAGLDERVELRLQDYRDIRENFDHIVSIEMFEAVGEEYWPIFLETLKRRLKPGGRVALQTITINDEFYENYRSRPDFIQLYIFPGGMLASPSVFRTHTGRAGLMARSFSFHGCDYARTLRCWQENLQRKFSELSSSDYSDSFLRMWQYYLAYCEAGFSSGRVDLMQTVMEHNE
jgi:cyclopropane-fatty-acyl-phospholipid synthase